MRVEGVVFPAVWKRCSDKLVKGEIVIVQATVQHEEEDYKLLVEQVLPISAADAAFEQKVRQLKQQANARSKRERPEQEQGRRQAQGHQQQEQGRRQEQGHQQQELGRRQEQVHQQQELGHRPEQGRSAMHEQPGDHKARRLYIKITAEHENQEQLRQLKKLLTDFSGELDTVLFYEKKQQMLALNDHYRVSSSKNLIIAIEHLLGEGTAVIK